MAYRVKLLNTIRQVSKLTSTNGPINIQDYPNQSGKRLQEWNPRLVTLLLLGISLYYYPEQHNCLRFDPCHNT